MPQRIHPLLDIWLFQVQIQPNKRNKNRALYNLFEYSIVLFCFLPHVAESHSFEMIVIQPQFSVICLAIDATRNDFQS